MNYYPASITNLYRKSTTEVNYVMALNGSTEK